MKGKKAKSRRFRKKGGRKTFKKKNKNVITGSVIIYNHRKYPMPPSFYTSYESTLIGTLVAPVAAAWAYDVRLNGMYLPWSTGAISSGSGVSWAGPITYATATLMPQGWSNLMQTGTSTASIYDFYKVIAIEYRLKMMPVGPNDQLLVCVCPYMDTAPPASTATALADYYAKYDEFTNAQSREIKGKLSMHKFFGLSKAEYMADASGQYSAGSTGNPVRSATLRVLGQAADNSTTTGSIGYKVSIRYIVKMYFNQAGRLLAS
jgi:hypothetical protein